MIGLITTIALDVAVGTTWWLTKQATYCIIYTVRYMIS
jgi:hypothetical protein